MFDSEDGRIEEKSSVLRTCNKYLPDRFRADQELKHVLKVFVHMPLKY